MPTPRPEGRPPRRQRMRLPFENKKQDAGEWAYDHRLGLSVMVIVYLVLGIVFFASKIVIGSKPHMQGIYVDLQTLEELEAEKERLEREIQMQQSQLDWSAVRNLQSNESMLNENLRDDRGTNTSEINESARDIAAGMAANRAAYEAGLAEAQSILTADRESSEKDKQTQRQDVKYTGGVTVRFEFKNPVRTSRDLVVPAYKCEAGGQVVVNVVLNQGGEVISARVASGGDERMREEALKAARASTFNIDNSAPARHSGTITYTFIPQ
ncbi:MAG: TonB family protein [Alistipes sp.]|nr:TonB family protein [Alistipes sp.]